MRSSERGRYYITLSHGRPVRRDPIIVSRSDLRTKDRRELLQGLMGRSSVGLILLLLGVWQELRLS